MATARQRDCVQFYYRHWFYRFFEVRRAGVKRSDRDLLKEATAQRIVDEAKGLYNPLWAIRVEADASIHRNTQPRPEAITYKRHAEYVSHGLHWAPLQRAMVESSYQVLRERLPTKQSLFGLSVAAALRLVKTTAELDPVLELAFCVRHELPVVDELRSWAQACYSFYPPVYEELGAAWLKQQKLGDLYGVSNGIAIIDRPAAIGGFFTA